MKQVELNFEGGLTDLFPEWQDMIVESVYGSGKPFKSIAADLDMSSSELSRKIKFNPDDNVDFPIRRFDELLETTGDLRPVFWLVEKYLQDADTQKKQALNELIQLMPKLHNLVKEAGAV